MADPIRDDDDPSDIARFAPRRLREQPPVAERPYIASSPLAPWNQERNVPQERRAMAERDSWPERVPEPPVRFEEGSSSLFVRVSLVVIFAAVVAVGVIFAKPIVQGVRAWFDIAQPSTSTDRPTANNTPVSGPVGPNTQVAAAVPAVVPATVAQPPVAQPPANAQQAALAPAIPRDRPDRFDEAQVETSVRRWTLTIRASLHRLEASKPYRLKARIFAQGRYLLALVRRHCWTDTRAHLRGTE